MKRLLDPNFIPILSLLKQLNKDYPSRSITFFSEQLKLDRRTILKTIHTLQLDISRNHWENMLTIEIIDKSVYTTISPFFSIEVFFSHYMSESFAVRLFLSLFKYPSDSIDEICEYLYVSKATFYRRIKYSKEVLDDFNLSLDFTDSKNKLVGSETQIRYFFSTLFWEVFRSFPYSETSSSNKEKKELKFLTSGKNLTIPFILAIELQLQIALTRIEQGYVLSSSPDYSLPEAAIFNFSYSDFKKLVSPDFSDYSLAPSELEAEMDTLYFSFTTCNIYSPNISKELSLSSMPWSSPIMTTVQKFISYASEYFQVSFANKDYVYLVLNLYVLYLKKNFYTGGSLSVGFNSLEEAMYSDDGYLLDQVNPFFHFLSQKEPELHVDKFQKFYFTLLLRRVILQALPPVNVLVCSKISTEENSWVEKRIAEICPIPIQFHQGWNSNLDLIISDFPLPKKFISDNPDIYFPWLDFPNFTEWVPLVKKLLKIYFKNLS